MRIKSNKQCRCHADWWVEAGEGRAATAAVAAIRKHGDSPAELHGASVHWLCAGVDGEEQACSGKARASMGEAQACAGGGKTRAGARGGVGVETLPSLAATQGATGMRDVGTPADRDRSSSGSGSASTSAQPSPSSEAVVAGECDGGGGCCCWCPTPAAPAPLLCFAWRIAPTCSASAAAPAYFAHVPISSPSATH
uniref:Uncharacterized protein n=1 Tax=Oryza glumipatula TaxID=40148 RepID=A0A0E0AR24_9ORYZ